MLEVAPPCASVASARACILLELTQRKGCCIEQTQVHEAVFLNLFEIPFAKLLEHPRVEVVAQLRSFASSCSVVPPFFYSGKLLVLLRLIAPPHRLNDLLSSASWHLRRCRRSATRNHCALRGKIVYSILYTLNPAGTSEISSSELHVICELLGIGIKPF